MEIISRKEAIEKGLKRYFTGKPCKRGHISERNLNRVCLECRKEYMEEYMKEYREQNKEQIKEYDKEYREQNKEHYKEYNKEYYGQNKEQIKEYQEQNKEQIREYQRNRYATDENYKTSRVCQRLVHRTLRAVSSTKDTRTYEILGYCNEQLKESVEDKFLEGMSWDNYGDWHIDHIYPVSRYVKNGIEDPAVINHLDNLIPMWEEHNLEKSAMTLEEYLEDRKDLVELYGRFL